MTEIPTILDQHYEIAKNHLSESFIIDLDIRDKISDISTNSANRACVRFLISCLLAKIDNSKLDIRKPYTEIGSSDCYSGRVIDEKYVNPFIHEKNLPCNSTTAFLTPAFRNITSILLPDREMAGTPKRIYKYTLQILDDVENGRLSETAVLSEVLRDLINLKLEKDSRLSSLLKEVVSTKENKPLSSEQIVELIETHIKYPKSSRIPVLVVAAAYVASSEYLHEQSLPLEGHNAADKQTKSLGDIEVTLVNDENIVTCYEMKARSVSKEDVDDALKKVLERGTTLDNYIIVTTFPIEKEVLNYCRTLYDLTEGIEFMVLDCVTFLRHFLHFFHRIRINYLECYQNLLLAEPDSSVSQYLKEAFLSLRLAAEKENNR